jgi:fatty-acyl-CoA synthase
MALAGVAEATVVGLKHVKWQERPVAFVVRTEGAEIDQEDVLEHLQARVAKWWLPDRVIFIDDIPKTGTGKFNKKVVRDEYAELLMGSD